MAKTALSDEYPSKYNLHGFGILNSGSPVEELPTASETKGWHR
jgi:hypothetical protein